MTATEAAVRLVASPSAWLAPEAIRQLYASAGLEGARLAVGFPDLHADRAFPVGAALVTEEFIHPRIIGGDIGCGMALFTTSLSRRKVELERWAEQRFDLEHPWEGDTAAYLAAHGLEPAPFDRALGTLGEGNHFAELQQVEQVFDPAFLKACGVRAEQLVLLVHSGSRGAGDAVLRDFVAGRGGEGAPAGSADADAYLAGHDAALRWARANRSLIAARFAATLGAAALPIWDGCHNSITPAPAEGLWVHRRGAVTTDGGFAVIPGSRGALSYLVRVTGDGESHGWSLAHGAGRKWGRSEARLRMRERFGARQLAHTALGGRVICEDRAALYEEAPAAYKDIESVIEDLANAGLVSVAATFRPLLTYKTRKLYR
jgi:release factor H-coupled RctB family protein